MLPINNFPCEIEAHKGVATDAPENTMSAFRAAVEQRYDMIELDQAFTKDNVCVIHHDRMVGRTDRYTDGSVIPEEEKYLISDLTYEQLQTYDVGTFFDEKHGIVKFKGEKIPTFEDVLILAKESKIPLKLDNKIERFSEEQQIMVYDLIKKYEMQELTGITGFNIDYLQKVVNHLPRVTIHYDGYVTRENLEKVKAILINNPLYIWQRFDNETTAWNKTKPIDKESADLAREYGKVGVWILKKTEEALIAIEKFNVDCIETNGAIKPNSL